jgi:nitroimidazol reductase NimA-like FMN-containing flavoprotein (pyridoxamine 5'-phosphate oxidase superfamily)
MEITEAQKTEILDFLQKHNLGVLSTVSEKFIPAAAIVYYVADNDFNLYMLTKEQSEKAQNMIHNPNVAFVVFETGTNGQSAQMKGIAELIVDPNLHAKVIQQFADLVVSRTSFLPPLVRLPGESTACFKIKVTWMQWIDLARVQEGNPAINFTL